MAEKIHILFIDSTHPILKEKLISAGFIVDYCPDITIAEIEAEIHLYEGIITRSKITFSEEILDKATSLKFIGRVGAGMENIDVKSAERKGIKCFNSPEGNSDAVGEHAVGMLLSLMNNMYRANSEVKKGIWLREENRGFEIKGKIVGIIGYGNMGSSFARKLKGFEATVIAYDKYKFNYSDDYVTEKTLEYLLENSDIISLHVPLTEETHYMVNNDFLKNCKKNIYLINTSRGKVLNTGHLVENIKSRKVLGAALDVLEYEKKSFENLNSSDAPEPLKFLFESDRVLLTPHIAGWTVESNIKLAEILADKIIKCLKKSG